MKNFTHTAPGLTALAALCLSVPPPAHAQGYTLKTIASFDGTDGAGPIAGVTLIGNTLYGTTQSGGDLSLNSGYGDGTVFSLNANTGALTTLATFDESNGQFPFAGLTLSADGSTLYGTTYNGGVGNYGTIFSLLSTGGALNTLATFDNTNGANPSAGLTLSADGKTLYGTARNGGANNSGTVFSIPITGGTPTALAIFNGSNGSTGGYVPYAGLTLSVDGSTLYGTTVFGATNGGTIFSLNTSTGTLTTLATFNGTNGYFPEASLTLNANGSTLYGTTQSGGDLSLDSGHGDGTVFSLNTSTGALTTLAIFNGTNGAISAAGLTLIGNTLYGTTESGSDLSLNTGIGVGTVFSLNTSTGELTTLAIFNGTNGAGPAANLTLSPDGTLYGTTLSGGPSDSGTVFSLTPTPEPSPFVALGLGALSLCALGLRARKRTVPDKV